MHTHTQKKKNRSQLEIATMLEATHNEVGESKQRKREPKGEQADCNNVYN